MGVKAKWYGDLDLPDDGDPFEDQSDYVPPSPPDTPSDEEVVERIRELVDREAQLDAMGVRCPIKDSPDTSCNACPVRRVNDQDPLKPLCDVGVEMESLSTLMVARKNAV